MEGAGNFAQASSHPPPVAAASPPESHVSAMPLSLVARACLESNAYFIEDIFKTRVGINPVNRKRKQRGEFACSYEECRKNPDKFFEYTRVTVDTFDYILSHIKDDDYIKVHPSRSRAVRPEEKLFLTLR